MIVRKQHVVRYFFRLQFRAQNLYDLPLMGLFFLSSIKQICATENLLSYRESQCSSSCLLHRHSGLLAHKAVSPEQQKVLCTFQTLGRRKRGRAHLLWPYTSQKVKEFMHTRNNFELQNNSQGKSQKEISLPPLSRLQKINCVLQGPSVSPTGLESPRIFLLTPSQCYHYTLIVVIVTWSQFHGAFQS